MKKLLAAVMTVLTVSSAAAADQDRVAIAQMNKDRFAVKHVMMDKNDPDFAKIYDNYLYGDILGKTKLDDRLKGLINLTVLTSTSNIHKLYEATNIALKFGVKPEEIKDAVYQCAPYVGIEKVALALEPINNALKDNGISLPLPSTATVTEENRFEVGKKIQVDTYGERLKNIHENTPEDEFFLQVYALSSYCFGDFYSRSALNMKDRELLTVAMIASLGGQETQLKSHIGASFSEGATKEELLGVITVCMPHIGFPRTLIALGLIREFNK